MPPEATTLTFDWKFGTEENPTYIGSFVDWARAIVTTSAGSTNILLFPDNKPVDIDNAIPFSNAVTGSSEEPGPPYPSPNDVVYNAVTGMYTSTFNIAPFVGQTIQIDFQVGDENDQVLDSALFIDNLNITVGRIFPGKAASLAEEVIEADYLWGGKGYNFSELRFVEAQKIKELGYNYWNPKEKKIDFGKGLDCSGLSFWSYNRAYYEDEIVNWGKCIGKKKKCPIAYEGADGQYRNNSYRIGIEELQPGDLLFFNVVEDKYETIDHVAMYIGEGKVVHAEGVLFKKVVKENLDTVLSRYEEYFKGFGRVKETKKPELLFTSKSPIDLIIIDPEGITLTYETEEVPGMYYHVFDVDGDGELDDIIDVPEIKIGDYLIQVVLEPDALPTDTYTLEVEALVNGEMVTIVLAENVPISEIPSEGYGIRSTETEIKIITPKLLKTDVIPKLESAKTGHKIIDKEIDSIIKRIGKSLNDKFWQDASHLKSRYGRKVFHEEYKAVVHMHYKTKLFARIIPILERIIEEKQKRGLDTTKEELKLEAINKALPIFKEVASDLVKADEILAKIVIDEAKNTPIENPKFQKIVERQIKKAEKELARAEKELEKNKPTRAIKRFEKVWKYAQLAIKFAKFKKR